MNRYAYKNPLVVLIIAILILFSYPEVYAVPLGDLNSETLAVSLIIDTSGSMNTSDPQRLRESVANVFIDYLNPEDYLGIVTFNSSVDLVIPMTQINDKSTRNSFKDKLNPKLVGFADTDYKAALDMANKQLEELYVPNITKIVIFLTDGKPDPDPANITNNTNLMNSYMDNLWISVSSLANNKFPVYSIGFSDAIDVDILNRIATETQGDVRIFKDSADLDVNLIQMLKSREMIVAELLAPESTSVVNVEPTLSTDFWLKQEGYRNGEEAIVSASLMVGSTRVSSGKDLIVDKFQLLINYDDAETITVPLYNDGNNEHSDIRANDGIWSNKVVFDRNGSASAVLLMTGQLKDEPISLEKQLGEYKVDAPGNILVNSYNKDLWIKGGDRLSVPLIFDNQSSFKEVVFIEIDEGMGNLIQKQISLDSDSITRANLEIELNADLEKGIHDLSIRIKPLNQSTTIENDSLEYNVEIISYFENLSRKLRNSFTVIMPILGIFVGLPLLIYLLGMLFYCVITMHHMKIKGTLTYWEEINPREKVILDLSKKKKSKILISFIPSKAADFKIDGSRYHYDLVISKTLIKNNLKFILGWKFLLSKKEMLELKVSTTQPGIIEHDGDIFTNMNLYDNDEFASGGFAFKFSKIKSKWSKGENEGKDILEGRV